MKVLLTGGSGYLGAGVLARAPSEWTIAATHLKQPMVSGRAVSIRLDVREAEIVDAVVAALRPDVIIHAAALMTGDQMPAVNGEGSRYIARAAARVQARLIHLSSDVIFDGEHAPYDENVPPQPLSAYAISKAQAEAAVLAEHPHPVIVRTSLIYGWDPLDPRTGQILAGEMPRLFTDEYRCPIFRNDLADALLELATLDFCGVLNVAGPQRLSRYEFGVKLANAFGVEPRFAPAVSVPVEITLAGQKVRDRRPRDCTLVIARAQGLLKTRLRSVDEAVDENRAGREPIRTQAQSINY